MPIIPEYLFQMEHPNETAEVANLFKAKNLTDDYYRTTTGSNNILKTSSSSEILNENFRTTTFGK